MFNPEKFNPVESPQEEKEVKEAPTEQKSEIAESEVETPITKTITEETKYSPEAIQEQITEQATMIREWAKEQGFKEGKDYLIIENIEKFIGEGNQVVPHETKAFYMVIKENQYRKFQDYFMSQYRDEMAEKDPKNDARLNHSWGGRFLVGWAGVPCDTVAASDIENLTIPTHHQEFKKFFKTKTGFDLPSAEMLNPLLKEMSEKGLTDYEKALEKLNELKEKEILPDDGYGLIDSVIHAIELLKKAPTENAVEELPDELREGTIPIEIRTYADLTYNAEDIANFDRVQEITGVEIPEDARIDKIFDQFNFDRNKMEEICKDFSEYLMTKGEI